MRRPWAWLLVSLSLTMALSWPLAAVSRPQPVRTREGRRACLEGAIFLRVPLPRREGFAWVARRYTGNHENARAIERFNPRPRRGRLTEVRVPFDLLLPAYRTEALKALFPKDRRTSEGWEHVWGQPSTGGRESWAEAAAWFTGSVRNAASLRHANPKLPARPKRGSRVLIPEGLLLPALRAMHPPPPPPGPGLPPRPSAHPAAAEPPPSAPKPAIRAAGEEGEAGATPPETLKIISAPAPGEQASPGPSPAPRPQPEEQGEEPVPSAGPAVPRPEAPNPPAASPLTYGRDSQGPYAVYRLKAGEALYSSVVVRFTGNVNAEDVNAMALAIAKRSGIERVTGIPVGYPVKIPLDDLLPQYLPPGSSQYQAWAKQQAEAARFTNTYKNAALDGVVVILDPGHGGLDRGAMANNVWEDSYVYDIACRIHEGLERRTKARVLMTLLDPQLGYRPQDKERLTPNTGSVILTHPWFHQTNDRETHVEVNLRWYLANQYFLRLQKEGVDPHRVVFTSIHADSLYPSLRGSMFYIPGAAYRSSRWSSSGSLYQDFEEYRKQPVYHLSEREMVRSEGLSQEFAEDLEKTFSADGLLLHPYDPTRDHVVRGHRSWVPAVLRNTIVPCAVLIEVCNLNNPKDAKLIADPAYRQKVADAYIQALIKYYS